ncbi:MAG: ABC transporter ATP-binding protein [candidate division Zixibacteria bacterium]|nr:ABC transporter ATP-binding protein [candidate division Zixibacteria bacterium]MDH3936849.1 ABC transporter ATP-binding protein [candidate division Zixibacteria bacterium]MDH4033142.1 ABC transporter ATP-binding protein [candidate division Zixibacteria bacterium]
MTTDENKTVIETKAVTKEYSDNGVPVMALHGIDLTIEKGEFTAIVGPSGSGKTTFLNIISGLDSATEGSVRLDGKLLSEMSGRELSDYRRDKIGFIFQAYNLIPVLTVQENIEYIMLLQSIDQFERSRRVENVLSQLGLSGMSDRLPSRLSGGQQQRVAVARAIVSRPALVLADEPTANLDSKTALELIDMMRKLNEESGTTFVFSTHDNMIMERARRLIVLKDGRIDRDEVRA